MDQRHEGNRRCWNAAAQGWERLRDQDGWWRRAPVEPALCFDGGALELIGDAVGDLRGLDVGVVGSGDNYAAFALSGLGARVTSIDISEKQLEVAAHRARQLGLSISFFRADAADLGAVADSSFDLIFSSNGFFVWIAALAGVFREFFRVLRPGAAYVFYDIHPFMRPWKDQVAPLQVDKPYWSTGPFMDAEDGTCEFNWTLADLLNPLAQAGFRLEKLVESPPRNARFWQGHAYGDAEQDQLMDWQVNPRAALPVWLAAALRRP